MATVEPNPSVLPSEHLCPLVCIARHQGIRRGNGCARATRGMVEQLTHEQAVLVTEDAWPCGELVEVTIPLLCTDGNGSAHKATVVASVATSQRLTRHEAAGLRIHAGAGRLIQRITVRFLALDAELSKRLELLGNALEPARATETNTNLRAL